MMTGRVRTRGPRVRTASGSPQGNLPDKLCLSGAVPGSR